MPSATSLGANAKLACGGVWIDNRKKITLYA
jgi:hypothetical protein